MSIRSRLLWLTLLAILLPALLQLARYLQERERTIAADSAQLMMLAQRRVNALDERIQGTAQLLFGLARAQDLASDDRAACSAFLSRVREAYPQYTGILTIRPDGRLFCDSLRSGRELDLRDRGYFQAALKIHDQVALEPVFGRLTGVAVLQIAYPVRNPEGALQFVLLASLSLPKLLEGVSLPVPGAELLLLSDQGQVLATTRQDPGRWQPGNAVADDPVFALARHRPGRTSVIPGASGHPMVWAVADEPATRQARLHVLASAPQHLLVAPANRRFIQDLSVLAAAAVALFAAMWLLTERVIRRQISRIADMANELAAGRLATRLQGPLPRGELGALMGVLNQTAEALEQQGIAIAELNERLRRSQRLEAVGQLTGGVAHDFNNLLTVVMGNAELLVEMNAEQPAQRQLAEMIGSAAQRGAELTQRLLAFARKQALDPKVVDLNELLAGMDGLLRRSLGEHIEIEAIRSAGLWPALVDPGQMENALLNLCLNARDAMPGGGRLTLETANTRLDADYAARHAEVNPGHYVMLAVSDTGVGIAPEHLQRVFEPFFTTKEKGKGTGLGLAMVYGFCKQSGGHVTVYSEPDDGTTVRLYLPRAEARPGDPAPADADTAVVGGHETILVVEDDAAVRQYACTQLKAAGYRVLEAPDGPSAMSLLDTRDDVDLLFTDIVMPGGMNGRALAEAACQRRPGLRVLYTSGYTENAIVHQGRLDADALLLSKPYRRQALDRAVRAALARPASPTA